MHCLINININIAYLSDANAAQTLWGLFCELCVAAFTSQQEELLEAVTSNMWTLLRNCNLPTDPRFIVHLQYLQLFSFLFLFSV